MAFKWVQCRYCGRTMHINDFATEERRHLQRTGSGVCRRCSGANHTASLIVAYGQPFLEYLSEQHE